jgi:hypothetical protein
LALEYTIRNFQENKEGLEWSVIHKLLAYAADINLLGENVNNLKKKQKLQLMLGKEVHLEVMQRKLSTCSCLIIRLQEKIMKGT